MARNEEQEKKKVSRKHNMRKQTKRMLIGVMIMVSLITTGCTTSASREEELREHFREISDRYPTENLMDLLVEGEIHQLNSDLSLYVDGKKRSEAMVLLFNGREGKITGQYQITIYGEEKFESSTHYGYNIAYTEEGVQLLEEVADEELKERILSFRPMIQYLDLNQEYLKGLEASTWYIPNNGSVGIKYELGIEDENVKRLEEENPHLDVSIEEPILTFHGNEFSSSGTMYVDIGGLMYLESYKRVSFDKLVLDYGNENREGR